MKSFALLVVYHSALVALISLVAVRTTTAFVVSSSTPGAVLLKTASSRSTETMLSMSEGETEIEKLLRMARELRAQAEESEKEELEKFENKQASKEVRLGGLLNTLFYDGSNGKDVGTSATAINAQSAVVTTLKSKNPSVDTLEQFVDWMDDRRDVALGNENVDKKGDGGYAAIKRTKDDAEAGRLNTLIESLLDSLEVIDNDKKFIHEKGHVGSGHTADDLRTRLRGKRRVRDEQFLERQQSFVDAQTIKEGKSKYEYHDEFLDDLEDPK